MPKSAKMPFISTSLILAIKIFTIKKNFSIIIIKKKYFVDIQSLFAGPKRQKYNLITFIILKKPI